MGDEVVVLDGMEALSHRVAGLIMTEASGAIERTGRFSIALAGGSTPRRTYELLATAPYSERIEWPRVNVFFGDERCVPPDHQDSNYGMARKALLEHVPARIFRMCADHENPARASRQYEDELRSVLGSDPRLDMVLLGIGDDGHTASLFPGTDALDERTGLVCEVYVPSLHMRRLTLTYPALNSAHRIVFMAAGISKAQVLKRVLGRGPGADRYPASRVRPTNGGNLLWVLDRHAASALAL